MKNLIKLIVFSLIISLIVFIIYISFIDNSEIHFSSQTENLFQNFSQYFIFNKNSINSKTTNPIFIVEGDNEIKLERYGSINEYNFTVKNYTSDKVSKIDINYVIQIIADSKVNYTISKDDKPVDLGRVFTLPNSIRTEDRYILKLDTLESYNGIVKINILANQKEEK